MMKSSGRITVWAVLLFIGVSHPDTLFSQWYGEVAYRYGVNQQAPSSLELAQPILENALTKPYTLGGYTLSAGYKFRPDSMITAWQSGISYWSSRSGTMLYTSKSDNAAHTWLKHEIITFDVGVAFEFSILKMAASTGLTLLLPLYTKGAEFRNTEANTAQVSDIRYRTGPGISIHQDVELWSEAGASLIAGMSAGWIQARRKSRVLTSPDASLPLYKKELRYLTEKEIQKKGSINDPSLSGFDGSMPAETQTYNEPLSFIAFKLGLLFTIQ
jgi:hypothetical protein